MYQYYKEEEEEVSYLMCCGFCMDKKITVTYYCRSAMANMIKLSCFQV